MDWLVDTSLRFVIVCYQVVHINEGDTVDQLNVLLTAVYQLNAESVLNEYVFVPIECAILCNPAQGKSN